MTGKWCGYEGHWYRVSGCGMGSEELQFFIHLLAIAITSVACLVARIRYLLRSLCIVSCTLSLRDSLFTNNVHVALSHLGKGCIEIKHCGLVWLWSSRSSLEHMTCLLYHVYRWIEWLFSPSGLSASHSHSCMLATCCGAASSRGWGGSSIHLGLQ